MPLIFPVPGQLLSSHREILFPFILGHLTDFEDYDLFEKDFGKFIENNSPLVITDPNADPFICGHWGGGQDRCGHHVSEYADNWRKYKPYE